MSFVGDVIGSVLGGITGSKQAARGAAAAAQTQSGAADRAIAEARAAREANATLQQPFVDAGSRAIAQQMSLIGLNGTGAQQEGVQALLTSPEYATGVQQGEEAILASAAATGGLRGGNVNNSLARFRAELLANVFNNQFARLGSLTTTGQNAAAGVGNAGLVSAANIGNVLGQQGAAVAGGQIAMGNQTRNAFNDGLRIAGAVAGF